MRCSLILQDRPKLASEIRKIVERAQKSRSSMLPLPIVNYVPLKWSLEDARIALGFEDDFKIVLVQFQDHLITGENAKDLTSNYGTFIPETQLPYAR